MTTVAVPDTASPTPRLSPTTHPQVAAHRGASGYRPEHTLGAYLLAIEQGADAVELDLVSTADGILVARHDVELGRTTDVAAHPEFADRRTTRVVEGTGYTGWFVDDLTLAELRTLRARERFPRVRPTSTVYDGRETVPTLDEILGLVERETRRRRRPIGVLAELKHSTYFDGRGLSLDGPLLADLRRHGADHAGSHVRVMAFEPTALQRLSRRLQVPLVQLLDAPADLARIARYADAVGPHTDLVLPRDARGAVGGPSGLVPAAHRRGLAVWTWTVRAENRFLPTNLRCGADPAEHGDVGELTRRLLDAGVDGVITDQPDVVLAARERAVPAHA